MNRQDVLALRKDFPMLNGEVKMQDRPLVWLDNASTTFKPTAVLDAVTEYYTKSTSNSHRGDYDLCYKMDVAVMEARRSLARLLNADPSSIVFTSGATNSINLVAYGYAMKHFGPGDEILITEAEHASNVLPWYRVKEATNCEIKFIPLESNGRLSIENLRKTLTKKTKLVAIAHITNVLGYEAPIEEIAKICHENGTLLLVDGAQSVPHMEVDVKKLDVDFLCFSGHKMLGPTGIGVLYGKYDLLSETDSFLLGGGMNVKFDMCGNASYLAPPMRFEAGTQNLEGILGLHAASEYLQRIGLKAIEERERELKRYAVAKLQETGCVKIYNPESEAGIVTFNVDGVFAQDAATYFNSKGIALRSGQHCAKILNDFLQTPATIRASFYFYTLEEEIDALVDAVKTCKGEYLNAYFNV